MERNQEIVKHEDEYIKILNLTNPPYLFDKQARNNSELSLQNLDLLNLELTDSKIRIIFQIGFPKHFPLSILRQLSSYPEN